MKAKIVLLVDDDVAVRGYVNAVLQQNGYQTIQASDGAVALEVVRKLRSEVELVISDIRMPKMSGIALAQALRAEFTGVPLILMSGYYEEETVGLDADLIEKPFVPATLLAAVSKAIPRRNQAPTNMEPNAYVA
jgi:two-component system cell cycle response regulator CpdR